MSTIGWNGLMGLARSGINNISMMARRAFEEPWRSRRAFEEPMRLSQQSKYHLLWAYYNESMFDRSRWASWGAYKANYNLYRNIRLIYNSVPQIVDFYAAQVYPGVLSEDGLAFPDGSPSAIPFTKDTPEALIRAVAQIWEWSNWQANKSVQVRYGAALGDVFTEVVDDVSRGKVYLEVVWPGEIVDLQLDPAGNVKYYAREYNASDEAGSYVYRKEVDQETFRYFRDGYPFDYGEGSVVENPYGFCPGVWTKHKDVGGQCGVPAAAGIMAKLDEVNNLTSHSHDQIHKVIGAPWIFWTSGRIENLGNAIKRGATSDFNEPSADQESLLFLKGSPDGKVSSLAGNLNLADAHTWTESQKAHMKEQYSELSYYEALRSMSQATGPVIDRLVGDVQNKVIEAQANYDRSNKAAWGMAVAIAGHRLKTGAWGSTLSEQQALFSPYDLNSHAANKLRIGLAPRKLINPTRSEQSQERMTFWQAANAAAEAGVPVEVYLREAGWTEEQINQLGNDRAAQIQRDQMFEEEDTIPTLNQ